MLVGPKRSGKGTIGRVLTGLLGKHNVAAPTLAGMATNFGLSPLIDRPLALISDARLSSRADTHIVVERLLSVSGEDPITIDRKYKEPWTGRLPTRFLVLSNELPRLEDSSGALSSRFIMLVLTKSFYGKENPSLTAELLEEASGVFNWAMGGLDRLMARGYFEQPQSGAEAIRQMEDLASPIAAFIREECVTDARASVPVESLWAAWKGWCDDQNRGAGTKATFGRNLTAAQPTVIQSSSDVMASFNARGFRLRPLSSEALRAALAVLRLKSDLSRPPSTVIIWPIMLPEGGLLARSCLRRLRQ